MSAALSTIIYYTLSIVVWSISSISYPICPNKRPPRNKRPPKTMILQILHKTDGFWWVLECYFLLLKTKRRGIYFSKYGVNHRQWYFDFGCKANFLSWNGRSHGESAGANFACGYSYWAHFASCGLPQFQLKYRFNAGAFLCTGTDFSTVSNIHFTVITENQTRN